MTWLGDTPSRYLRKLTLANASLSVHQDAIHSPVKTPQILATIMDNITETHGRNFRPLMFFSHLFSSEDTGKTVMYRLNSRSWPVDVSEWYTQMERLSSSKPPMRILFSDTHFPILTVVVYGLDECDSVKAQGVFLGGISGGMGWRDIHHNWLNLRSRIDWTLNKIASRRKVSRYIYGGSEFRWIWNVPSYWIVGLAQPLASEYSNPFCPRRVALEIMAFMIYWRRSEAMILPKSCQNEGVLLQVRSVPWSVVKSRCLTYRRWPKIGSDAIGQISPGNKKSALVHAGFTRKKPLSLHVKTMREMKCLLKWNPCIVV